MSITIASVKERDGYARPASEDVTMSRNMAIKDD